MKETSNIIELLKYSNTVGASRYKYYPYHELPV